MSELEKLLEDYYRDMRRVVDTMISWCEPTPESIQKIRSMKRKSKAGLKMVKELKSRSAN